MPHHLGPPPAEPDFYGYSCQAWFSLELVEDLFGTSSRRVWFSTSFNPVDNAPSSNPVQVYLELSQAVKAKDVGSKLIRGYRASLIELINKQETDSKLTSVQASDYRARIVAAPVESFRPEVWRLDLRSISEHKYVYEDVGRLKKELRDLADHSISPPQLLQPDEYLINDLQSSEYHVIIVG